MSSDTFRYPPDAPWKPVGTGHAMTFLCDSCRMPRSTAGRRKKGPFWHCAACIARNEKARTESIVQPA